MKLYINFNNKKYNITTHKYSSISSIIAIFDENLNSYADYNGQFLNKNLSLDYYNISDGDTINISNKVLGGNNIWDMIIKHPFISILIIIFVLLPLLSLPAGYFSTMSALIKVIIDKSISSISRFLICNYGKSTIINRFYFIISIFKFLLFILIIYVTITLPITILFLFLKGHKITDDPSAMCEPLKNGANTGGILTFIYFFFYILYRGLNKVIDFFIGISDKYYTTSSILTPTLKRFRSWYNRVKYLPGILAPDLRVEFLYFDKNSDVLNSFLNTIVETGCVKTNKLAEILNKNLHKFNKNNNENNDENHLKFNINFPECNQKTSDGLKCCTTDNYLKVANILFQYFNDPNYEKILNENSIKTPIILIIEAFFEKVLASFNDNNNDKNNNNDNDNDDDDEKNNKNKYKIIEDIKEKMKVLDNIMNETSKEKGYDYDKSKYTLTNKLFKYFYVNAFCNIVTTAHSTQGVLKEMGDFDEIIDMMKSGMVCGSMTAKLYFLAIIIIIIMSIFGFF